MNKKQTLAELEKALGRPMTDVERIVSLGAGLVELEPSPFDLPPLTAEEIAEIEAEFGVQR